jgi:hypothetical protein
MARKSRDFKDLMKQGQSSQDKRKNLEALRQKMQKEGIFGELVANMPIEPKGAIKMSDVLQEFVEPYLDTVHNLQQCKTLFNLAAIAKRCCKQFAWNAAVICESEQQTIDEFLEENLATVETPIQQGAKEIITQLITRKHQHFSHIKRLIMDFDVTQSGQRYDISVASTLVETE